MRHRKNTCKLGRTSSHRRCMVANMLKSLIENGRIETTIVKAKELRRHADRLVTLAKQDTLFSRRRAISQLMITFNRLTPKEARKVKETGVVNVYNTDRKVLDTLFKVLGPRFISRDGGYTRIIKKTTRVGDNAPMCFIEYLSQ